MADEVFKKISFELEQDADGYPPDKWESLWASEADGGLYTVDNIPFYVKGISSGDKVSATADGDQLVFQKLVEPSSNSVFRLYLSDASRSVPRAGRRDRTIEPSQAGCSRGSWKRGLRPYRKSSRGRCCEWTLGIRRGSPSS